MPMWKTKLFGWLLALSLLSFVPPILPSSTLDGGAELLTNDITVDFDLSAEERSILDILGSLIGLTPEVITSFISITKIGLGVVTALETMFEKVFDGKSLSFDFTGKPNADKQLLAMFEVITLRLEQIQRATEGTEASLLSLSRGLPNMVRWEIALDTLEDYTKPINNLYHRFAYYQIHKMDVENHTLLDFANSVVSHSTTSIQALMANIHSMVAPSDPPALRDSRTYEREEYEIDNRVTKQMSMNLRRYVSTHPALRKEAQRLQALTLRPSVFIMLEDAIKSFDMCNYKQSPQQLVFGMYILLSLTLARGYAMISFSYNILRMHNQGNFTVERELSDSLYTHYGQALMKGGFNSLNRVSNSYRRCDPLEHIENQTYVAVTELLQGYIENEVDMNGRGTCGNSCSSYQHAKVEGCYLPDSQYCGKHRRCKGQVHECKFFDADASVCISEDPYKRYDWVKYENNIVLGRENACQNEMKIDSWYRFFYHCSYCMCLCDDPLSPTSDRYISLLPVVSDVAKGMVVTGIRFTKVNRVIHLQIQQGKAMPQGQVDPMSLLWVEPEPISVGTQKFVENEDYFTLKYEARNIDLDHLKAPKSQVVTGVKFRMLGSHVNLEIWVTPVDFSTGKLNPNMSYWISNDNTPIMASKPRRELKLYDPDDPRKVRSESEMDSTSDMFVTLQPSSMEADVSQLTIPFFDAQPVSPSPSTWLEGIQIYHRGRQGFGGFIGFKLFNFNLKQYFEEGEMSNGLVV